MSSALNLRGLLFHRRVCVRAPFTRSGMADSGMPTSLRYCGASRSSASVRSACSVTSQPSRSLRPSMFSPMNSPISRKNCGQASMLYSMTQGSMRVLAMPCGTWNMPPMGVARGVHGADAGVAEGDAAEQRAHGHVVARPGVAAVEHRGADALADELDALRGERVGVHRGVHRDVGLDVVDQGVHAAGGGDALRAAVGEHGVDERDVGDEVRAHDACLLYTSD